MIFGAYVIGLGHLVVWMYGLELSEWWEVGEDAKAQLQRCPWQTRNSL